LEGVVISSAEIKPADLKVKLGFTSGRGRRTFFNVLQRRISGNGVVYYVSPQLEEIGVCHAFSTRCGGISTAPFDSLNLGNPNGCPVQDDVGRIKTNYTRLHEAIKAPDDSPLWVHQVHGNNVEMLNPDEDFDIHRCADAIVSRDARRSVSIRTADCVPILIASADGKTVAAVHAGWKGIIAGVISAAIARMTVDRDQSASDFRAAIGPCIGREAFEVGAEVLAEFTRVFGDAAPVEVRDRGKGRVDLRASARLQLLACGLNGDRIDSTDRCTVDHSDEFFSHRREKGVTGRMAAVIAPAA
jgi:YfiH family protein